MDFSGRASRLAGPRRNAVGPSTGRPRLAERVDGSGDVRVGQRSLGHATEGLAGAWCLLIALVGGNIEGDEQDEVRAEDANTSEGSEFLSGAFTVVGHVGEVARSEVGVRGEVDESCVVAD